MIDPCEVCQERNAVAIFRRIWHDGTIDEEMPLCHECAQDDPDGMYTVEYVES